MYVLAIVALAWKYFDLSTYAYVMNTESYNLSKNVRTWALLLCMLESTLQRRIFSAACFTFTFMHLADAFIQSDLFRL